MEKSLFLKYFQQIMEQFKLCVYVVYTAVGIFHAIYLLVWNLVYYTRLQWKWDTIYVKIPVELRIHYDNHSLEHHFFYRSKEISVWMFCFSIWFEGMHLLPFKESSAAECYFCCTTKQSFYSICIRYFFRVFFSCVFFFSALVKFINHIVVFIEMVLFFSQYRNQAHSIIIRSENCTEIKFLQKCIAIVHQSTLVFKWN